MNRREAITALMSLPAATRISVADLKPDDVIVIETDSHLRADEVERIRATLERVWPGRKAAVLSGGLKLKVVSERRQP